MSFIWPPLLASLLLLPVGILLVRRIEQQRLGRVARLGGLGSVAARPRPRRRDRIPSILVIVALALLGVALARPQAAVSVPRVEGTVILTFDVSGSMAADDVQPSRMEQAKAVARAFAEEQPDGVVIGVVAFSDAGLTVQAPSGDPVAVIRAIDRLAPALGTSLGEGMLASLTAIADAEADVPPEYYSTRTPAPDDAPAAVAPGSHPSAAIVLLSDGENTTEPDPIDVALTAADRGIRVHTVGVGTTAGTTLDLDGFLVHTRLDEPMLREVARITAGTYHAAEDAGSSIDAVHEELGRRLTLREDRMEVTALLAGAGLALLAVAGAASLVMGGRLP